MKKTLSITLAFVLSFLMIPAGVISGFAAGEVDTGYTPDANAYPISSVADFEGMGKGNYYLTKDLDFSGRSYTGGYVIAKFNGTLDGCGHSITGITVTASNGDAGIIGKVEGTASIKNLIIGSATSPAKISSTASGKSVGALIAAAPAGVKVTIENVQLHVNVSSVWTASGIVGYMAAQEALIKDCEVNGAVSVAGNDVAGIVGRCKDSVGIRIENCVNNATISSTTATGKGAAGIFGTMERGAVIVNCVNNGSVTTQGNYAGGIIGYMSMNEGVGTILVQKCSNHGTITAMNTGKQSDGTFQLTPNTRYAAVGGIIGGDKDLTENRENTITIDKCMNYGLIKTNGTSAGAIMGKGTSPNEGDKTLKIVIKDTGNVGRVEYGKTDIPVGSFVSYSSTNGTGSISISNCFNMGTTNSDRAYAGIYNEVGDPTVGDAVVSDFYYLGSAYSAAANVGNVAISNAVAFSADQFKSGEVAYNLGFNFGQTLGEDDYPVPGGLAVVMKGAGFSNLRKVNTKANGATAAYVQNSAADTQGKQTVRVVLAVNKSLVESVASAEMIITFKKAGANGLSYTLKQGDIKLFKSVNANGELYLAEDGCAILGATVKGVVADAWDTVQITFNAKDASGANVALISTTGSYSK